jgi:O-antigen ligase
MKYLRFGLYALVVFAVAAHGVVEDWALMILVTGATVLLLAWAAWIYVRRENQCVVSPLLPPLVALCLLGFAQWVFHLTASSYATRMRLQLLVACTILLFLAGQVFRSLAEWREFVWFLLGLGFVVCIFGILQHLTFNGKIYWVREMYLGGVPFGPYVNRNHFAAFAELVIPIGLVPLALGRVRKDRRLMVGVLTVIPIVALLLSASRGGIVSFAMQLLALAIWMVFRRSAQKQLLVGIIVIIMAVSIVSWIGAGQTLERFAALRAMETTVSKRDSMRADTWRIFVEHPVMGTGLGTLETVFPRYETLYDGKIVDHAHNDYLEALADTGIVGGLFCAWFLAVLFGDGLKQTLSSKESFAGVLHLSGMVACIGFLVHSLVDFNLHIPANALLFFLQAHLAAGGIPLSPAKDFKNSAT